MKNFRKLFFAFSFLTLIGFLVFKSMELPKESLPNLVQIIKTKKDSLSKNHKVHNHDHEHSHHNDVKTSPSVSKVDEAPLPYENKIVNRMKNFLPEGTKVNIKKISRFSKKTKKGQEERDFVLVETTFQSGEYRSYRASVNPKTGKLENASGSISHGTKISFKMNHPETDL